MLQDLLFNLITRLLASRWVDESVPHCAWAGRLRRVSFNRLVPDDAGTSEESSPRLGDDSHEYTSRFVCPTRWRMNMAIRLTATTIDK